MQKDRSSAQLQCQQNHCRYCSLCTLRKCEKAAWLWLCCFLSFYCVNSPKIHINITFSLGLNQAMNNKSKQQLPTTMPVKFHVLILRDCDWFFHSFPPMYEMWLDIWSLSAAQLSASQTVMGQWWTGLTQRVGGQRWHKMGLLVTQLHVRSLSCAGLQKAPVCQNSDLCGPQASQEMHKARVGHPVFGWVEVLGRTGRVPTMPALEKGDSTSACAWAVLQNVVLFYGCPGSKFLLGLSSRFVAVPLPSSYRGCRDATKQPGGLLLGTFHSWSTAAISLSISSFMPIVVHDWKSDRHVQL